MKLACRTDTEHQIGVTQSMVFALTSLFDTIMNDSVVLCSHIGRKTGRLLQQKHCRTTS